MKKGKLYLLLILGVLCHLFVASASSSLRYAETGQSSENKAIHQDEMRNHQLIQVALGTGRLIASNDTYLPIDSSKNISINYSNLKIQENLLRNLLNNNIQFPTSSSKNISMNYF